VIYNISNGRTFMKEKERKFLRTLYERGKRISKPPHYQNLLYMLSDIMTEAEVNQEDISEILESVFVEWIKPEGIRLTTDGLNYCQEKLDKRPLGFLP